MHTSQVAYQGRAYPGFTSMKSIAPPPHPLERDASLWWPRTANRKIRILREKLLYLLLFFLLFCMFCFIFPVNFILDKTESKIN